MTASTLSVGSGSCAKGFGLRLREAIHRHWEEVHKKPVPEKWVPGMVAYGKATMVQGLRSNGLFAGGTFTPFVEIPTDPRQQHALERALTEHLRASGFRPALTAAFCPTVGELTVCGVDAQHRVTVPLTFLGLPTLRDIALATLAQLRKPKDDRLKAFQGDIDSQRPTWERLLEKLNTEIAKSPVLAA